MIKELQSLNVAFLYCIWNFSLHSCTISRYLLKRIPRRNSTSPTVCRCWNNPRTSWSRFRPTSTTTPPPASSPLILHLWPLSCCKRLNATTNCSTWSDNNWMNFAEVSKVSWWCPRTWRQCSRVFMRPVCPQCGRRLVLVFYLLRLFNFIFIFFIFILIFIINHEIIFIDKFIGLYNLVIYLSQYRISDLFKDFNLIYILLILKYKTWIHLYGSSLAICA